MSESLTPTEEKVYKYLIEFLSVNSYQPSIREIGREFDIKSTKTVSDILGNLARKGYIQRNQSRSRGLRILGAQGATSRTLPVYDEVADFGDAIAPELRSDWIVIDRRLAHSESAFFVRVADDAMADGGIRRSDTVLVDPEASPADGELVAVRVGRTAVVRTFEQRGAAVRLTSPSPITAAIEIAEGEESPVLGVVRGAFRVAPHGAASETETVAAA